MVSLSAERAWEIIEMNKRNEIPESIGALESAPPVAETVKFMDGEGETRIDRFTKQKKKKHKKHR